MRMLDIDGEQRHDLKMVKQNAMIRAMERLGIAEEGVQQHNQVCVKLCRNKCYA